MIHKTETIFRTLPLEIICSQLTHLQILGWHIGWSAGGNISLMRYRDGHPLQLYIPYDICLRVVGDNVPGVTESALWLQLKMASVKGL